MNSSSKPYAASHLPVQILCGMLLGVLVGYHFGSRAEAFGILGRVVIDLIKALAVPLAFFAILEAVVGTQIPLRAVRKLFTIVLVNAVIACTIALTLANAFRPGDRLRDFTGSVHSRDVALLSSVQRKSISAVAMIADHIPKHILQPFIENDILMVVFFAVLLGLAIRSEAERNQFQSEPLRPEPVIQFCLRVCEKILSWLLHLVPFAVFGVCAKTVGQYGFRPFEGLLMYVLVCLLGLILQCVLVYQTWIAVVCKKSLCEFWKRAARPLVYAFGVNSSLATLPLTLSALDDLNVRKSSSRLGACVGTNFNNDGILLYEAMAVLFVAQAYGLHPSLLQQLALAGLCVLTAIGVAGVPEAGIISLSLVLTATGMPTELLPVFLTVDWIVARARSVTNVLSDMTVSIALDGINAEVQ